jgi:predicted nucleotidyltransferase
MPCAKASVLSRLPVALRDRLKAVAVAQGQSVQDVVERADPPARPGATPATNPERRAAQIARRQVGTASAGREQRLGFGSVARDEAHPDSDVDLALEFDPDRQPTLFALAHLQELVEAQLGTKVDLGLRRDLRPRVAQVFERDAVRAF